jgi:hypothetical protein
LLERVPPSRRFNSSAHRSTTRHLLSIETHTIDGNRHFLNKFAAHLHKPKDEKMNFFGGKIVDLNKSRMMSLNRREAV